MNKECLECNRIYQVPKHRYEKSKYCGNECRIKSQSTNKNPRRKRKVTVCKNCGNNFEQRNYLKGEYCTKDCYWDYRRKNPYIKFQSNQGTNLIQKECLNCNITYEVNKYREKNTKYCSISCHDEHRRDTIVCPTCKKLFTPPKFECRKYCSQECSVKGVDKRKSRFSSDVYTFLNGLYEVEEEHTIKGDDFKFFGDILLKKYNIIIECYGDYWHCNPKIYNGDYYHKQIRLTSSEIWERDLIRKEKINKLGYSLITLWEFDWNNDDNFFNKLKNNIENEICKNKRN